MPALPTPAALTPAAVTAPDAGRSFPPGFWFGSATAAQQVEGAAHEDGRRDSIWDAFARVPGATAGGDQPDVACDQYHRYRDDVALMAELGLHVYRFSTSWARVRPDGGAVNPTGLDYYSRLVDELLAAGIVPWLTLYHWDLPQALEEAGGWTSRDTASRFADYAESVHAALGDRVPVWTTLNEPWCSAFLGYTSGVHAPGRRSPADGLRAAHHLLLGHGLAVQRLRALGVDHDLGITLNFGPVSPADPADPADVDAARRADAQFNRVFLDPLFRAQYPADLLDDLHAAGLDALDEVVRDGDLAVISSPVDVLGVNYYQDSVVSAHGVDEPAQAPGPGGRPVSPAFPLPAGIVTVPRDVPHTDMGWEINPDGLTALLLRLQAEYTGPAGAHLAVTENGAAFADQVSDDGEVRDPGRQAYLRAHLAATAQAIEQGADVRAYLAWSLLDNFEWACGYRERFGIVHVDYPTQRRTVKSSGRFFSQVARSGGLPA